MTLKVLDFPEPGDSEMAKVIDERLQWLVEYARERRPTAMLCVLLTDDETTHVASHAYEHSSGARLIGLVELAKMRIAREVEASLEEV